MKITDPAGNPYASLSTSVWRGSTVVFDSFEDFVGRKSRQPDGYSYGLTGTPTARGLEGHIAALEGARHCVVMPSGASALITTVLAFVRGGDHLLISESCYGSLKTFGRQWLANMGVDVEFYPPTIDAGIDALIRPNTKMICMEAPGTVTMEMQDIDAITAIARRRRVLTMMDNTWASPLFFKALDHGVDFVVQAATKYFGGHSDLLMGCVSLNDFEHYSVLRETQSIFGQATSPEDCFLVERGLQTYELRLREQSRKALNVARWLEQQPQVAQVMFPALESDPGHRLWREQFQGSGCLLSIVLQTPPHEASFSAFFNTLQHFPIGASWGGTHSLIAYYPAEQQTARLYSPTDQPVVRLSIGLENESLLIQDLSNALQAFGRTL
ncbi:MULTISPECIES: PLP-dependent aspartate aminotransferase family protein [unclassified Pseudomonas]|uniref:trans-sulfuration enzyme family protein n=1 Tax=unclassified Pseudomonas TaxID=196821 RepID=UPI000BD511A9|nr:MULTISPECIES: PLP-dependent transferase [unclassified Pseudomonas]PVZ20671.1 cystathionine beta-lyase [Pseudomonas sp. URIL14HWK12:I12]PVZ27737.1 cystathionine beta-lyase [Pseudomonas sp. URIL14HWK12:I10]PVZ38626.1 cystathionine beta-lyase [Pseudomonas sp. URIL14HWK12:I11]SNZ02608.1 cystathionine beta-lyase [Pseudomonas sp. URIL14HWK12:I9]